MRIEYEALEIDVLPCEVCPFTGSK